MASQPLRRPTYEVSSFLSMRGKDVVPELEFVQQPLDQERGFAKQSHSREKAIGLQRRFEERMKAFCVKYGEPEVANFDVRTQRGGWTTVLKISGAAVEQYQSKRKGWLRFLRAGDVMLGKEAAMLEPLLELLPCGEYTSVVCGGIKLIYAAFKHKADIEQAVLRTLGEAPERLEWAEDFLKIYHRDALLEELVDELFMALLKAIEAMVEWLTSKMARFRGMFSTAGVDASETALEECRKRVESRADQCQRVNAAESEAVVRTIKANVMRAVRQAEENHDMLNKIIGASAELRDMFMASAKEIREMKEMDIAVQNRTADEMATMNSRLESLKESAEEVAGSLAASLSAAQQRCDKKEREVELAQEKIKQLEVKQVEDNNREIELQHEKVKQLEENNRKIEMQQEKIKQLEDNNRSLTDSNKSLTDNNRILLDSKMNLEQQMLLQSQQKQPSQVLVEVITVQEVVQWLGMSSASSSLDAAMSLRATPALSLAKKLSNIVAQSSQLLRWLSSDYSAMLFIEPVGSIAKYPKASPGSFVTASLDRAIGAQDYALVLKHFCAQHQYMSHGVDRVSDVVASLVVQLLELYPWNLSQWSTDSPYGYSILLHRQLLEERDQMYLCRLFKFLVTSLQSKTAFVLLDDFYLLERSAEDESLDTLFTTFWEIIAESPNLKVLCMTPEANEKYGSVSKRMSDHKVRIDLEDVERGGKGILPVKSRMAKAPLAAFVDLD